MARRRIARDYTWQSGNWVQTNEVHYVYDGMLPIQERDGNNNVQVTYTRGIDLSSRLQRAGGIGGLLARTDENGSTFYHPDGNGNVTALMNGSQNIVARYLYNPFGKLIGEWGGMADANKYRFSSKELDPLSGMYYYGFRFYDPNLQRWLNQDPMGEWGGINLYGFNRNDPLSYVDPTGRAPQLVSVTYNFNTGQSSAQYQPSQFGQGYGIGFNNPPLDPIGGVSQWLDQAWNYGLDQITPPLDPNQHPYWYAGAQTGRDMALAALVAAATDRVGKLGSKGPVKCPTAAAADAAKAAEFARLVQARERALDVLNAAEKNLAQAQDALKAAQQAEYAAQQAGKNSVYFQQAQQAVQDANNVVAVTGRIKTSHERSN